MQILLFLVDGSVSFITFVCGYGQLALFVHSVLFNTYYKGIMVTTKIGKHTVEYYDAIDELPIIRFHKYQKFLLIDAGVGADITAFDQRCEKIRRFLMAKKNEQAEQELENLRQSVFLIQTELNPTHRAFAALVTKIDGQECTDLSDDALAKVTERLTDVPIKDVTDQMESVKKKLTEN